MSTDRRIFSLSLAHMVTDIYLPVITTILPLLISTYGYTYFLAGLLVTSYNITSSLMQPLFGWASDRHGFRIPIAFSLLISGVFIALMGLTASFPLLLLCAALGAIGHASFHPAALSLVSRIATNINRGRITSFFVVGGNLGYAIGPLLAGTAIAYAGLAGTVILVIPALVMAALMTWIIPGVQVPAEEHRTPAVSVSGHAARKTLLVLFLASMLRAWAIFAAIAFLPPYLIGLGYSLISANVLVSAMLLCGVAGQVTGGMISDRWGRKEFVVTGLLLSIPFFCLFLVTGGLLQVVCLLIFGYTLWSSFAITVAMSHEIMPDQVGLTSGLMIGVAIGAGGVGVALSGYVADNVSLQASLLMLPVLIVMAALLVAAMKYPWRSARYLHSS